VELTTNIRRLFRVWTRRSFYRRDWMLAVVCVFVMCVDRKTIYFFNKNKHASY
jgi:hypothetical protein